MNILFIGPYRQNDEWGYKSQATLKSLQNTEHTITSRPIYMSSLSNYNNYIEPSETIISDSYDILIQFVLPTFAIYKGDFKKRIGIFHTETIPNNIPIGELTTECLMDEIWVDSKVVAKHLQNIFINHNHNTKVQILPPTLNLEQLPTNPSSVSIRDTSSQLKERFIFYYIGNILEPSSGFKELYTAYLNAFSKKDAVALIIGLNTPLPPQKIEQCFTDYKNMISFTKPEREHPSIHVISPQNGILSLQEKIALYTGGDCMIDLSYAMTTPSTVLEGALYQSTPIVNKNSVIHEWLGEDNLWCVDSYEEICSYPKKQVPAHLYRFTSEESWYQPITKSVIDTMQQAYTNKFKRDKKKKENAKLRQFFQETSYKHLLNI